MPLLSESSGAAAASAREWCDAQVCEYGNQLIKRFPGPNGRFPDELYDLAEDPDEEHGATATRPAPPTWPSSQRAWTSTSPATKISPAADSASPNCPSTTTRNPGGWTDG